jgi:ATP-dependent DNA helicase DinG
VHEEGTLRGVVARAFAPDGELARAVTGFEPREGQRRMAESVADVIETGGTLLAEAGTGTGKTLAYLTPAILSGHRVLISTGTKNLQEQIFDKDLPALAEALGVRVSATLMKGRGNYLCLHRLQVATGEPTTETLFDRGDRGSAERAVFLPVIEAWAATTATGDRAELRDLPEDLPLWGQVSADADTCLGSECPRFAECFVTRMRQRAAESDVVIVNHHLLCADAAVRHGSFGEVVPSSPTLVVDEAHQLEDVATAYFGIAVSNYRIDELARDGERLLASIRAARRDDPSGDAWSVPQIEDVARATLRVSEHARRFFDEIATSPVARALNGSTVEARVRYTSASMTEPLESGMALAGAVEGLEASLALGKQLAGAPDPGTSAALDTLVDRASGLRRDLQLLLRADDPDLVYSVETRGRGVFLRASPVDVSRIVREAVFDRFRTVVLTSATLAIDASFEYVKGRLGVRESDELRVPSEFDFANQALIYLPRRMPTPKSPGFAEAAAREIVEILRRTRGRAFVLFTSYGTLRAVQPVVEESLPFPVLVQGQAPRSILVERFRSTPHAVLLATSSFWQGVDVVGDALSCVVIDKLPFAVPSDPVTSARIDTINARGGDAFADYQVPLAILALQQGLGRLIRHRTDRGVLAVLDPRVRTTGYGRRFLAAFPPAPVTHDLDAIARFFG